MASSVIGRTVRRLRLERGLTQQALAARLGISASYLNLIEHEQRGVAEPLLARMGEALAADLATLLGAEERQLEAGLREVFGDVLLDQAVPDGEVIALAGSSPAASRAVLALYRAWRVAREDASGIALPTGRRFLLPNEEARDAFHERGNHFPALEAAAETVRAGLDVAPAELNHAIAERLRERHGLSIRVAATDGALRAYDAAARSLVLSEQLPRESRDSTWRSSWRCWKPGRRSRRRWKRLRRARRRRRP